MSSNDLLIWTSDYEEGFCVIQSPSGIEDSWELDEGVSRKKNWPSDVACKMDPEFEKDIELADNLYGSDLKVVSAAMRVAIEAKQPSGIEFLPTAIINHKGRVASEDYFVLNPLTVVDCIDIEASEVDWNDADPDTIMLCEQLVLKSGAAKNDVQIFRPKHWPRLILARSSLAEALEESGFSGLQFMDPMEYTGLV